MMQAWTNAVALGMGGTGWIWEVFKIGQNNFKLVGIMILNAMGVNWVERNFSGSVSWSGIWIREISDLDNLPDIREFIEFTLNFHLNHQPSFL